MHYEKFADGTIKCIEDEIPFEVPEGWAWTRLKGLFTVCSSKRVLQSDWKKNGIPFYRAREIVELSDSNFVDNELFISEKQFHTLSKNYGVPLPGDLMVSGVGTIGKVYIVKPKDRFYYKDASVLCFENRSGFVVPEFARILLESEFIQKQMKDNSKGTTVDTITISTAMNYLCIIPPINEQIRIISVVQHIVNQTNVIHERKKDLQTLVTSAKEKVLDLAVRGKLIPQNDNDEPASVLLERIRAEKEELIKQGKIKRDKRESVIYRGADNSYYERFADGSEKCIDEEIPFEIPKGWEWTRFSTVITLLSGQDLLSNQYNDTENGIPYITGASNIENGNIIVSRWTDSGRVFAYRGDLLLTCKGTIGEMAVLYAPKAHIARQIMAIRSTGTIEIMYIKLVLDSLISTLKEKSKGLIPGITRSDILDSMLPLPSNTEQKRIITCIENLANQLDAMAESLS